MKHIYLAALALGLISCNVSKTSDASKSSQSSADVSLALDLKSTYERCHKFSGFDAAGERHLSVLESVAFQSETKATTTATQFKDTDCKTPYTQEDVDAAVKGYEESFTTEDGFTAQQVAEAVKAERAAIEKQLLTPSVSMKWDVDLKAGTMDMMDLADASDKKHGFTRFKIEGNSLLIARICGEFTDTQGSSIFGLDDANAYCHVSRGLSEKERSTHFENVPAFIKK